MPEKWFAAQVRPSSSRDLPPRLIPRETGDKIPTGYRYVLHNLKAQGFETYCPVVTDIIVVHGQKTQVYNAALRGYFFIVLNLDEPRWTAAKHTHGVASILPKHSLAPMPVPDAFIKRMQEAETLADQALAVKLFSAHQVVQILRGAFVGQLGTVVESGPGKTRIEAECFGRQVPLTIDTRDLAASEVP